MKTTTDDKAPRMRNPVHPGHFLRTEVIEAYNLSVTKAAKILHVARPTLSSLLNAKADLSGEMALRFEKAFGIDMDTLMRMQNSYDIAQTRNLTKKIAVERYRPTPAA
jgi:addiction module HigA family antidote